MIDSKCKQKIQLWYENLDERKRKALKFIGISLIPLTLIASIGFIILAVQGLIGDVPWFLYIDFRYIGYTLGIGGLIMYMVRYLANSFSNRKKNVKSPPPNFIIQMYFGFMLYLIVLIFLPFGEIY